MDADDRAFLGRGWAFPVAVDAAGDVAGVEHEKDVRQSIRLIMDTEPGERAMRPDFGAGLRALSFEPMGATTRSLVRHRVERALVTWEPRIDVEEVRVDADPGAAVLLIEVDYRVRSTNTFYNLVHPFYLAEGRAP